MLLQGDSRQPMGRDGHQEPAVEFSPVNVARTLDGQVGMDIGDRLYMAGIKSQIE